MQIQYYYIIIIITHTLHKPESVPSDTNPSWSHWPDLWDEGSNGSCDQRSSPSSFQLQGFLVSWWSEHGSPFYRTQVRSLQLPCLVRHSLSQSSCWDLIEVTLACEDACNLSKSHATSHCIVLTAVVSFDSQFSCSHWNKIKAMLLMLGWGCFIHLASNWLVVYFRKQ